MPRFQLSLGHKDGLIYAMSRLADQCLWLWWALVAVTAGAGSSYVLVLLGLDYEDCHYTTLPHREDIQSGIQPL